MPSFKEDLLLGLQQAYVGKKKPVGGSAMVETEFGDTIPAPDAQTTVPQAAPPDMRTQIMQQIEEQQRGIDSTYQANVSRWREEKAAADRWPVFGVGRMGVPLSRADTRPEEQKQLAAAAAELKRARKEAETYTKTQQQQDQSKGQERGWLSQLWGGATDLSPDKAVDVLTGGMASTSIDSRINPILEKKARGEKLTDTELAVVQARGVTQDAQRYVAEQGGATTAYAIGGSLPGTAQFMVETAATGGSLGVGKAIVGGGAKAIGRALSGAAAKEAVRTTFRGSMWQDFEERTGDQYVVGENGEVIKDETPALERAYKSYMSTFSEGFTEQLGNVAGSGFLAKGAEKIAPKLLGKKMGGALVNGATRLGKATEEIRDVFKRTTNYNGTFDEFAEELVNNIIEPILTGEPERIKENFSSENMLVTLGSVALVGSAMHAANLPSIARYEIQNGKLRKQTNGAVSAIEDQALRQGVFDALKKGQTVEQKAAQLASLDWNSVSQSDAAHVVDAFSSNLRYELFKGVDQEQSDQEVYAQQYALFNAEYKKVARRDTGAVQELLDDDGGSYYLLAGSLDGSFVDNTVFVYNMETGKEEQLDRNRIAHVEPPMTYGKLLDVFNAQSGQSIVEQSQQMEAQEMDADVAEAGVSPVGYAQGEVVDLADGRVGDFIGYLSDGVTAQVAILNEQIGEPSTVEVHKNQIIGLSDAVPAEVQPTTDSTPDATSVEQAPEIPLQQDGTPDYEAMSAAQFLEHYGNVYSREEAVAELEDERKIIDKQIAKLNSGDQSLDRNTRAKNRHKIAELQARLDDIALTIDPKREAPVSPSEKAMIAPTQRDQVFGFGDPRSLRDYILREIVQGKKFRWKDEGSSRGMATELGFVGKEAERRVRIGLLKADGDTPAKYAEHLTAEIAPQFGVAEYGVVFDEVLDVLLSVNSKGQAFAQLEELRKNRPEQIEAERAAYLQEQAEKEELDASVELNAYLSQVTEAEFLENEAMFAEELLPLDHDGSNKQLLQQPAARPTETGAEERDFVGNGDSRTQGDYGEGGVAGVDRGREIQSGATGAVGSGGSGSTTEPGQRSDGLRSSAASDQIAIAPTDAERRGAVEYWVRVFNEKHRANVSVFAYIEELPEELRPHFDPSFENSGVSYNGASYLNATAIRSKAELEQLYVHEVVGHQLVDRLPLDQRKVLFEAVVKSRSLDQMVVAMPAFDEVAKQYSAGHIDGTQVAREYLAYLAERSVGVTQLGLTDLGEVLVVDASDGLSDLDFIEVLTALANGVQSIEVRTEGSSNSGILNSGYSAVWRESVDGTTRRAVNAQSGAEAGLVGDARTRESEARSLGEFEAGHSADTKQAQHTDLRRDGSQDAGAGRSLVGTDEVAADPSEVRFSELSDAELSEMDRIKSDALIRGDFMRAPNGNPTNLTERQWLQARTESFKKWFGDWEHAARIEKLRVAEPISIRGDEITPSEDLKEYRRNAFEYGKQIRGAYVNQDTNETIVVSRSGLEEVLHHDATKVNHLQSIAAIPQIIEKSTYVTSRPNTDTKVKADQFRYYVCGLKIAGVDYTVKMVVAEIDGKRYYDHALTQIEKSNLIDLIRIPSLNQDGKSALLNSKDKRLLSILQVDASKIVDENGEPLVVYHGTDSEFYKFKHSKIKNQEGSFFFAQNEEDAASYSGDGNTLSVFINLRRPADFENLPDANLDKLDEKRKIVKALIKIGYDGWASEMETGWGEVSVFYPNQVKSATENTGEFSAQTDDIRFKNGIADQAFSETERQQKYEASKLAKEQSDTARRAEIDVALQKLTQEFGVATVQVDTAADLPAPLRAATKGRRFAGLYHKPTGAVYLIGSELHDVDHATATYLHEVVAHKGIDGLLGQDRAAQFYTAVFDALKPEEQARLLDRYGDKSVAGDEVVARMAEGDVTLGTMQRIIAAVRRFFREVLGVPLTTSDTDIRYILFKSKVSLQRTANLTDAMKAIEADQRMRAVVALADLRAKERAPLEQVNDQFNQELVDLQGGRLRFGHVFSLGMPSEALLLAGVPVLPIELEAVRLQKKSEQTEHPFDLSAIKNLPEALAHPIAVFDSKRGANNKVVLTELSDGKMNFVVAIQTAASTQRGRQVLEINDVRSLYPKEFGRMVHWIEGGLMRWVDKPKALAFLEQNGSAQKKSDDTNIARPNASGIRRSYYAEATSPDGFDPARVLVEKPNEPVSADHSDLVGIANIVQNFENPTFEDDIRHSEIEPIEDRLNLDRKPQSGNLDSSTSSISATNLLKGVEKSKGEGEFVSEHIELRLSETTELPKPVIPYRTAGDKVALDELRAKERRSPIEKLRSAEPVLITGNEIEPSDDLKQYRRNALEYGKTIRGAYTNKDTGQDIRVSRESITEVLSHSIADTGHIASVAAIPDVIENATYITTLSNEKQRSGVVSYDYYACGLKIGWVDYTVKMVVANTGLGDKYYDHKLTEIEKGRLLDLIQSSKEEGESTPVSPVIHKSGSGINPPLSEIKDTRLISILQNNLAPNVEQDEVRLNELDPIRLSGDKKSQRSYGIQFQEAVQDATIKVHLLQNEVKQGGGEITPLTNAYEALNHVDSRADAAMRKYKRRYMEPIVGWVKKWRKAHDLEYADVTDYLRAKHSLERHASGISALDEKEGGLWTKEHATELVDRFESIVPNSELSDFWIDWRRATIEVLEIGVRSGRMSLGEKYEILHNGWRYYVPLRGKDFDFEQVADMRDVFYYDMDRGQGGTSVSKRIADVKAMGRSSKASDPIAMLQYMANNEIYLSEQNNARRTLLRLVESNPGRTDLFTVRQKWYVKSPDGLWAETDQTPDAELIQKSVAARKALRTEKDPARRAQLQEQITVSLRERDASKVYTGEPQGSMNVSVMKDGVRYTVELADPEVASAINYKAGGVQRWASKYVGRPTRIMAQLNTSKNPAFILPNFVRDMQQAALYHFVDSEGNIKGFMNHALGSWKILDRNLRGFDRALTAAELDTLDITNQADRAQLIEKYGKDRVNDTLYDLFAANGGETGYVHIADPKDYQRKLEKEIQTEAGGHWGRKAGKGLNTVVDYMAAMSENSVRYATFVSQLETGKSVFDAVVYAKNITVNFNRKGKYAKGIGALFMFFNAGIQGVDNQLSLIDNRQGKDKKTIRKQRARFVVAKAIQVTLGYYSSYLLGSALSALIGDDGEEYTVSDYERRTNFIFPVGGKYVKIPIAIPDRPFYALGVMVGDMLDGKMTASDVTEEFASMFIDAYNPIQSDFIDPNDGTTHLKRLIPSSLKPMSDLKFNQDYMGLPISKKKYDDYTPDSQLGLKKTAWWAKAIAKELNEWGGGNSATPAGVGANGEKGILNWLDVSPGSIEHLLGSYSGGMGRIVSDVAALIGGDTEVRRWPIVNRFVGEPYEKRPSSDYYKLKEAIEFRDRNNRKTVANGEQSTIYSEEEFEQKAKTDQEWRRYLQQSDKQIKKLREELDNAPDGSAKHDQIEKEIARQQREFIKEYNAQDND